MLLDRKNIKIENTNSKLSFGTTGGGAWKVWDRFLLYDNEQLFHIGNICGTCAFFFRQIKTDMTTSYTIENIRAEMNSGINKLNDELIKELSTLMPVGEYEILLLEIRPFMTRFNGDGDYFVEEQSKLWDSMSESEDKGAFYYRGTDSRINETEKLYEFFIPLYQPNCFDESRIEYYQKLIRNGEKPTALALGVVDSKECVYCDLPEDGIVCHWSFANYLLDGHHKIQAAAREKKPITLISFIAKDYTWQVIDELIKKYEQ